MHLVASMHQFILPVPSHLTEGTLATINISAHVQRYASDQRMFDINTPNKVKSNHISLVFVISSTGIMLQGDSHYH